LHSATVLDVGHGNSIVLNLENNFIVVDIANAAILLDHLANSGTTTIDAIIITHADADHVRGLLAILTNEALTIGKLYINPDPVKDSEVWLDVRCAAKDYARRHPGRLRTAIHAGDPGRLEFPGAVINVLAPDAAVALAGTGRRENGHTVTANDHSVVLQIIAFGRNVLLLLGDLTPWGWAKVTANSDNLTAEVVILPHHGGSFGSQENLQELLESIKPQYAVATNGRNRFDNPQADVVSVIRRRGTRMVCTQLANRCGEPLGERRPPHPACAGDVTFEFHDDRTIFSNQERHGAFIDLIRETALCRNA
jgi:beta-lactamase superfamily II metal-dependent hydrolase